MNAAKVLLLYKEQFFVLKLINQQERVTNAATNIDHDL